MKYLKVAFFPTLFVIGVILLHDVQAETLDLDLSRMIIVDGGGIAQDSYVVPPRAQGNLELEVDSRNIVRGMQFDAWWRGADQPVLDDWVLVLDYIPNGAQYEVMSLWTNDQYYVTFLRRAPQNDSFDPAVIMMIEMADGDTVIVDYRYR